MARCKHYVEAFDCCAKISEFIEDVLWIKSCYYKDDVCPNCRYFEEKEDVVPVEWISVKDRLPDNDIRVLVAVDSDKSDTKIDTDRMVYRQWVRWGMSVTHWMPLPESPKKPKEEESAE